MALLLLRIASAMAFLYHGSAILFGSFGGPGPQQFAASHHWPVVMGYLIGLAQLAGGLAVLSGVLFRLGVACERFFWFIFPTGSILAKAARNMHSHSCYWQ
jgi:uncharacterized membrane protein YphA (DoxX/SURF4 family)